MRVFPSRRTAKRWGIGIGIVLGVLLLVNAFMSWRVNSQFNARVAAIRAAGDPASIADLKPEPIPAEENAAAHLDMLEPRLDQFGKEQHAWEKDALGEDYAAFIDSVPPSTEQVAAMRAILDKYAELEEQIAAAAACKQYASTADFSLGFNDFVESLITRLRRIRAVARMVNWRAATLIAEDRRDEAVERWLDVLRLAKLHEAEPALVSQLVTFAVRNVAVQGIYRALAAGPISPEAHERLEQELARADDPAKMEKILRTERAVSVSASLEHSAGETVGAPRPLVWFAGWTIKRFFLGPLDYYEVLLPIVDRPWPEIEKAFAPGGSLAEPTGHGVMADLLVPALVAGLEAGHRDTANVRALRVFNALQQFALKNGREASGLGELGLPTEATVDPFSGKSLVAKRTDDGWLVYSVGANGKDDGGDFEEYKDVGVGPAKKPAE
jgi:hypothetical protein